MNTDKRVMNINERIMNNNEGAVNDKFALRTEWWIFMSIKWKILAIPVEPQTRVEMKYSEKLYKMKLKRTAGEIYMT